MFSIHRFLGYDLKHMTHEYISFIMDFFLLLLLIFVWKPIALGLIYAELFCKIVVLLSLSILHTLMELYPPFLIKRLIVNPYYKIMSYFVGISFLPHKPNFDLPDPREIAIQDLWECIVCVGSLSLLMRFISGPPSTTELKKHKKLAKLSVIYRVFRHMI